MAPGNDHRAAVAIMMKDRCRDSFTGRCSPTGVDSMPAVPPIVRLQATYWTLSKTRCKVISGGASTSSSLPGLHTHKRKGGKARVPLIDGSIMIAHGHMF